MTITLNGEPFELEGPRSVSALLADLAIDARRVAVEHNLTVLKAPHETADLKDGDQVEIVNFVLAAARPWGQMGVDGSDTHLTQNLHQLAALPIGIANDFEDRRCQMGSDTCLRMEHYEAHEGLHGNVQARRLMLYRVQSASSAVRRSTSMMRVFNTTQSTLFSIIRISRLKFPAPNNADPEAMLMRIVVMKPTMRNGSSLYAMNRRKIAPPVPWHDAALPTTRRCTNSLTRRNDARDPQSIRSSKPA